MYLNTQKHVCKSVYSWALFFQLKNITKFSCVNGHRDVTVKRCNNDVATDATDAISTDAIMTLRSIFKFKLSVYSNRKIMYQNMMNYLLFTNN